MLLFFCYKHNSYKISYYNNSIIGINFKIALFNMLCKYYNINN